MAQRSALAIGVDPVFAISAHCRASLPNMVRAIIDAQIERFPELNYQVESCMMDLGESAEETVESALSAKIFDCILIGAGLPKPPERLLLFEKVINLVHLLAPQSRIAVNTTPADTAEAVQRWVA